ncbi:MAG: GAF domain-containing protein [Anaerolineaceae bacterium]|nr:GAF domain-containing protein [Anaerolineaceae bacterium]
MSLLSLRALIVEDSPDDAFLLVRELKKGGFDLLYERVDNEADMRSALQRYDWEIIFADYSLPQFDGLRALALLQELEIDIPVILISGTIGEELAVEAMKAGAQDYLLKGNLHRLQPAVNRTLREAENRQIRQRAEAALSESQARLFSIITSAMDAIIVAEDGGQIVLSNEAAEKMFGYNQNEFLSLDVHELFADGNTLEQRREGHDQPTERPAEGTFVTQGRRADGKQFPVEASVARVETADRRAYTFIIRDITQRLASENALRESEEKFRQLAERIHEVFWVEDLHSHKLLYISPIIDELWGTDEPPDSPSDFMQYIHPDDLEAMQADFQRSRETGLFDREFRLLHPSGKVHWVWARTFPVEDEAGNIDRLVGIAEDVTHRKLHESELEAIVKVSSAMRTATNKSEMVPAILEQVQHLLAPHNVAITLVDSEDGKEVLAMARGNWAALLPGYSISPHMWERGGTTWQCMEAVAQEHLPVNRLRQYRTPEDEWVIKAPMVFHGDLIGAVWVTREIRREAPEPGANPFSREELVLLNAITDIAANAIQRETLYDQTARRAFEFTKLYEATAEMVAQKPAIELLETTVQYALEMISASTGGIFLFDAHRRDLELVVLCNYDDQYRGMRLDPYLEVTRDILTTHQPAIINNYSLRLKEELGLPDVLIHSAAMAPMSYAGRFVGILFVAETRSLHWQFTENDLRLLSLLSGQAASAVHTARLFEETRSRLAELEALNRVSTVLRMAQTSQEIYVELLDAALKIFDSEHGALILSYAAREVFQVILGRGMLAGLEGRVFPIDFGVIGHALAENEPYVSANLFGDPLHRDQGNLRENFDPLELSLYPVKEAGPGLAVPLRSGEEAIGVLVVARSGVGEAPPRLFGGSDLQLAETIAEIAGNAIHRTQLFEKTRQYADQLATVSAVGRTLAETMNLIEIYDHLGTAVMQLLPDVATILISLFDAEASLIHCVYCLHENMVLDSSSFKPLPLAPPGEGTQSEAIHTRKPVIVNDLPAVERGEGDGEDRPIASALYVPMIAKGRVLGVIQVQSYTNYCFSQADADLLVLVGNTAAIAIENASLFQETQAANTFLEHAYDTTLEGWARALELRDQETEGHSQRVALLTLRLAAAAGITDAGQLAHVRRGALLHDIGKMGIPDNVLLKPGPLDEQDWKIMRRHPVYAFDLLSRIAYLQPALDIPYCHHEKWDGSGYPRGLQGEEIPLAARVFTLVDVWDALLSNRPYRPARGVAEVIEYIRSQAGRHFDPHLVELFLRLVEEDPQFLRITQHGEAPEN